MTPAYSAEATEKASPAARSPKVQQPCLDRSASDDGSRNSLIMAMDWEDHERLDLSKRVKYLNETIDAYNEAYRRAPNFTVDHSYIFESLLPILESLKKVSDQGCYEAFHLGIRALSRTIRCMQATPDTTARRRSSDTRRNLRTRQSTIV